MLWWLSVAPFGKPVVPLVYWMLIGSSESSAVRVGRRAVACQQLLPLGRVEQHDALELGQVAAHLVDHRRVVAGLERAGGDQHPAAGLAQRVLELARAVGRVDVDEDDPGLRGGELGQHPLGAVGRPDADAVALLEAGAEQPARERVDLLVELGVREPDVLVADHERLAVAEARDRALEVLADRLADQRLVGDARRVGRSWRQPYAYLRLDPQLADLLAGVLELDLEDAGDVALNETVVVLPGSRSFAMS